MRILLAVLFTCAACSRATPAPASAPSPSPPPTAAVRFDDPQRVSRIVDATRAREAAIVSELEKSHAPGAAMGLVVDGQLVYFKAVGVRELASDGVPRPVDEDTVFRIASMSKAFVTAAMVRLRDDGKLALDDAAEKYVPALRTLRYPTIDSPRITIRQLISHSAGLPEDNAFGDLRMSMSEAEFDGLLAEGRGFSSPPATQYEYSNLGFALAGRIISRVSGMPFQEYITRTLFVPLGMTSTTWDGARVDPAHKAHGYGRKGTPMPAKGLAKYTDDGIHDEPEIADGAYAAIGGVWTTPRDYARWLAFQLSAWPPRDDPDDGPVRRASIRETHSRQSDRAFEIDRQDKGEFWARSRGYAMGWTTSSNCRFDHVISHGGALPGYGSFAIGLLDRGIGVFTMTNLTYTQASDATSDLVDALSDQGLIPARPIAVSPALESAVSTVLSLLRQFDRQRAQQTFDRLYPYYESFDALQQRLAKLRGVHGECRAGATIEPENQLRGRARLDCQHGELELTVTLTSDVPSRIQSLSLESALPPSRRLTEVAVRTTELLTGWDEPRARELFATPDAREVAQHRFAALAHDHGSCGTPRPDLGDGASSATFRLPCERGDLELHVQLSQDRESVDEVELSRASGSPRCPL